jgi:hypothetical protein
MSLDRVIAVAEGEVGKTEWPPDSNNILYNTEYYGRPVSGSQYKWCVSGLWWVYKHADEESAFFGGGRTASCGTLLRWYSEMGQTVPVLQIQRGDIAILNFSATLDSEHCGLVTDVQRKNGSILYVRTVEFNTTPGLEGSQDNGGSVASKIRYPKQIVGVCRPRYKEEPVKKDDLTGHWAEAACRKAEEKGVMRGYPDGSWAPDKTLTRAELATVLDRLRLLDGTA